MHEAVLEDRFDDSARAVHGREQRHEQRLHVGREARVGKGLDVGRDQFVQVAAHAQAVDFVVDGRAAFHELRDDGTDVIRHAVLDQNVASGDRRGDHERSGLDAVRDDRVAGAVQRIDTFDADRIGAGAFDLSPHLVEEVREIDDLGLLRRIFNDGRAPRQRGGHHDVFRSPDTGEVQIDQRAFQTAAGQCFHDAVSRQDLSAQKAESLVVQVDRTVPDGTAAGKRDARRSGLRQKRTHHEDGCAHLFDEFVRDLGDGVVTGGDRDGVRLPVLRDGRSQGS